MSEPGITIHLPPVGVQPLEMTMGPEDYGILKMHALNGAQGQADGSKAYAENLRYSYLEGKDNLSMTEGLGVRYIQGPHPQFGSPDAK